MTTNVSIPLSSTKGIIQSTYWVDLILFTTKQDNCAFTGNKFLIIDMSVHMLWENIQSYYTVVLPMIPLHLPQLAFISKSVDIQQTCGVHFCIVFASIYCCVMSYSYSSLSLGWFKINDGMTCWNLMKLTIRMDISVWTIVVACYQIMNFWIPWIFSWRVKASKVVVNIKIKR